ncbi:MAG: hypothetical protein ABIT58_10470 [Ferruginibacter sp.]
MKSFIFLIIPFILSSCQKEETTIYLAYLKNTTNHLIKIQPYTSGYIVTENIINLSPGEKLEIANGNARGLQNNAGFSSKYFSTADSIVVTYDDLYSISHYIITPSSLNSKYYLYPSNRNLAQKQSYTYMSENLSSHSRRNTYNYEFIEQDFLDTQ